MASLRYFIFTLLLLLFISPCLAQPSFRPRALVLPVSKDPSTLQYVTTFNQRTPLVSVNVVVDLGGRYLWVDCERGYVSSTLRRPSCGSAECSLAGANGCGGNVCSIGPDNTVTNSGGPGEVAQDVLSLNSTDGRNTGLVVTVPRFIFACATTSIIQGLASGVVGMAGFGRYNIALPQQFAADFSFRRNFAVCLSSSTSARGVIFLSDGPYVFIPGVDASQSLTYTPLFINPISTAPSFPLDEPSAEYFIGVKSIKVNEKPVPLNTTLLSINREGVGGTKISTVNPYTVLEASIFKAVTEAFINEAAAWNITRVAGVAPFEVCFSFSNIGRTRLGAAVPSIDLVLENDSVFWRIFGANSMVEVNSDVLCLGFVNGGANPQTSIVIGGYQLEDNLVQFDLATSRLGFSSTLLGRRTTCANFNFTSNA
ncbi:putative ATP binding protein [Hibiscus syriacus]|uniref:ATP binding protein n=1 Tax=Hibiscus syriacus TaxID=106335 RepID=A0A6A2XMK2_HIBSY|nr:probable aspartic proteinase GIP2 [Hibiscus syriacus]KAE8676732.1 putative ATP binding protein [Hibiscus syriacus]